MKPFHFYFYTILIALNNEAIIPEIQKRYRIAVTDYRTLRITPVSPVYYLRIIYVVLPYHLRHTHVLVSPSSCIYTTTFP